MIASDRTYAAFAGTRLIASAPLATMLLQTKAYLDGDADAPILIFENQTGDQVDFDFRGTPDDVLARVATTPRGLDPGAPKLGVKSREVTLLPSHWDWLERQPNGISAALRRLVESAIKHEPLEGLTRRRVEAVSKLMWSIAGNLPDFEEASRALFALDQPRFEELIKNWPEDIRNHLLHLLSAN